MMHIVFPRYFNWKEDTAGLSHINRQVMYVHTFFIAFIVFLMGLLCITCTQDLITTPLGKNICLGLALFWLARLFCQFFVYSSLHWKGKRFETFVHIVFSLLWILLSATFLSVYFS